MAELTLRWVRSAADVPSLWATASPAPLEGEWWYETFERSRLEEQFRFVYGVLHLWCQTGAVDG